MASGSDSEDVKDENTSNRRNDLKKISKTAIRKKSRVFNHRQNRLIVRNLSYKINDDLLKKHFETYGKIEEVNILKRPDGRLVGCAFVQYGTKEEADKAITNCNDELFMGRPISVAYSVDKEQYLKIKKEKVKKEEVKEKDEDVQIQETSIATEEDEEEIENDDEEKPDMSEIIKDEKIEDDDRTVFMKNIPFDIDDDELKQNLEQFGKVESVFIAREKVSGHSKGTAFIKFVVEDSANMCIKQSQKLRIGNQVVEMIQAINRKDIRNKEKLKNERQAKDTRNLYLLKEGVIMAKSEAAKGVSQADMAQRLRLEQKNSQMLKNLNRFVSRDRLTIHNIPPTYGNKELKEMVKKHTGENTKECRVMLENKPSFGSPLGRSKGYGFVSFKTHEKALSVLRKLNNNPLCFGKNNRPIVSFSIEDKKVHNIKEARMKKSLLNNPTYKAKLEKIKVKRIEKLRKKKEAKLAAASTATPTFSLAADSLAQKINPKRERKRDVAKVIGDFTGEISKAGKMTIRSMKKIRTQAQGHYERIKTERKAQKKVNVKKEHEKLRNERAKNAVRPKGNKKDLEVVKENRYLSDTIGKYKKLMSLANDNGKRSKWYIE